MRSELATLLAQVSDQEAKVIQALTKASPDTVECWVKGEQLPRGELRVRLHGALHHLGYVVDEFDHLPEPARKLTMIITFDILSVNDIVSELGYTTASQFYRVVLSGTSLMPARATKMMELVAEYWPLAQEKASQPDNAYVEAELPAPPAVTALLSPEFPRHTPGKEAQIIAHLVQAMSQLLTDGPPGKTLPVEVASLVSTRDLKRVAVFVTVAAAE